MTRLRPVLIAVCTLGCLASATPAQAHGDPEIPLYVAEDGLDTGRCNNQLAPCGSISYALSQAGKGTEIRVAEGSYEITSSEDLFHLLSDVVTVVGGYRSPDSPFAARPGLSVLTGVPYVYRELLNERGFHIVADRKGIDNRNAADAAQLLSLHQSLKSSLPLTPCNPESRSGSVMSTASRLTGSPNGPQRPAPAPRPSSTSKDISGSSRVSFASAAHHPTVRSSECNMFAGAPSVRYNQAGARY